MDKLMLGQEISQDRRWMQMALELAAAAKGMTSPNPMVGAVIVKNGEVVGRGAHLKAGTPHAEVHALNEAGEKSRRATIYVTLEPCSHYGRTPPCTEAILKAGISRVVAATPDPNPLVAGSGFKRLMNEGVEVAVGVLFAQAVQLNQPFFTWVTRKRPWVLAKWAMTLDGKIACASGDSRWVTGEQSRQLSHQWRAQYDAILVGVGTVLADNPQLTTRLPSGGRNPARVILDSAGRIPLNAQVLDGQATTFLAVTEQMSIGRQEELIKAGAQIINCQSNNGRVDLDNLLSQLAEKNITSLLVEGGGQVHGSFFDGNFVDQAAVFLAPKLVGGSKAPGPVGGHGCNLMAQAKTFKRLEAAPVGADWLFTGVLQEVIPCLPASWKS